MASASGARTSWTWSASSRVGTSTRPRGFRGSAGLEAREHRQPEREGLARAGLGLAAHVAAGERVGDAEPLDGEGLGDALVGQDLHEEGWDAEVFEGEVVALGGRRP